MFSFPHARNNSRLLRQIFESPILFSPGTLLAQSGFELSFKVLYVELDSVLCNWARLQRVV